MEQSQGTSTGGDNNEATKVLSNGDGAKNYITRLARKVKELAATAKEAPLQNALSTATNKVADGLESAGNYLEERKFQDLPRNLITLIRKHPVELLLLCGGMALYFARRRKG
jgi:hypothetical protein